MICVRLSFVPPTSSHITSQRLLVLNAWPILDAFLASSFNLSCFSLSAFCSRTFFLSFYISYFHCFFCLSGWWLSGFLPWAAPSLSILLFSHSLWAYISPSIYSLSLPASPILSLPSYWSFSLLLDQYDALERQVKANSTYLYIIKYNPYN